jgi:hypothetical protein
LWFLALENVLINNDGYWIRASDYCLFLDEQGRFHVIPHDANETFSPGMGGPGGGRGGRSRGGNRMANSPNGQGELPPGRRGTEGRGPAGGGVPDGPRGGGVTLDPLVGLDDASKPLRSKLLAVPAFRQRYLSFVRTIAEDWLDWQKLGPIVDEYAVLIGPYLEADTRKLSSYDAFTAAVSAEPVAAPTSKSPEAPAGPGPGSGPFGPGPRMSLRQFADQRREFLLNHPEVKAAPRVEHDRSASHHAE